MTPYDVIKSMIMQIKINLPKILIWPIRPYNVSLYQIVAWVNENNVKGQKSWRIFYYVIWKNGLLSILSPNNMAASI